MKLSKNNFGKKLPENIFLSFNWLKPLGLEIWFSFFEDEAELKLPYDIFPSLYLTTRCGRVVTDFDWEAKNRFNF